MPNIRTCISIRQPIEQVFNFVTTVENCSKWYPSNLTGPVDHPLGLGESVTEEFVLAGRRGRITWTVRECKPPRRWVVFGQSEDGGTATLTYTLRAGSDGTRFVRELRFNIPVLLDQAGGFLGLRNRIQAEYAEALRRLKKVLEGEA